VASAHARTQPARSASIAQVRITATIEGTAVAGAG
jgi:hypothetical protein